MTIPDHLLVLARAADATKARERPELASRIAETIRHCLPTEPHHVTRGRLLALDEAIHPERYRSR